MKKALILFGGVSSEHDISLISAKSVIENTPKDIYEFSIILEDMLVDDYDEMYRERSEATEILANKTPDICASAELGMKPAEIEGFKSQLEKEYQRAKQAMR